MRFRKELVLAGSPPLGHNLNIRIKTWRYAEAIVENPPGLSITPVCSSLRYKVSLNRQSGCPAFANTQAIEKVALARACYLTHERLYCVIDSTTPS